MRYEGGFQGRTNKLVDGCYSFWQAATIPIVQALIKRNGVSCHRCTNSFRCTNCLQFTEPLLGDLIEKPIFDRRALQEYILICCQRPEGGLLDKPGK